MADFVHKAPTAFHFDSLKLSADGEIRGLESGGEVLRLIHPVSRTDCCRCIVMKKVETEMRLTLKEEILTAINSRAPTLQWYTASVSQAISAALYVEWTQKIEAAFKSPRPGDTLTQLISSYNEELRAIVESLNTTTYPGLRSVGGMLHRLVLMTEALVQEKVTAESCPLWQSMVKLYCMFNTILVKCNDRYLEYGFEYYGPHQYLMYTPQSQDAYGLVLGSFSNSVLPVLSGPPGIGKTETALDMAYILGKPSIVFLGQETAEPRVLDNFIRAMAYCGGMLIVDEANQFNPKLDYYSTYWKLLPLRAAGCRDITLEGQPLPLGTFAMICTCNPAYKGRYTIVGGTSMRMSVVEPRLIAEGVLYLEGFVRAKEYSQLIMRSFSEFEVQLSKRPYYRYGTRLVRRIVRLTKSFRGKYKLSDEEALVQAIHVCIRGTLTAKDVPIYDEIMKTLFGDKGAVRVLNTALHKSLHEAPQKLSEHVVQQLTSVQEHIDQGHSLLFLAKDDGIISILKEVVAKVDPTALPTVHTIDFAQTPQALFGTHGPAGWVSGTCEKILSEIDDQKPTWLVLKGPIEPGKYEPLLAIFDPNRTYTGPNGFTKRLSPLTKTFLIISSLERISPAAVPKFCILNFL